MNKRTNQQKTGGREMCTGNQQDEEKRPFVVYILVAAVIVLDLSLVYFVNVDLLPLVFDLDREAYRQSLATMVAQVGTTALGVFLGLSLFRLLDWPLQISGEKIHERD